MREETALGQAALALGALEAANVKVLVLNAQHLAAALLLARVAKRLTWKIKGRKNVKTMNENFFFFKKEI